MAKAPKTSIKVNIKAIVKFCGNSFASLLFGCLLFCTLFSADAQTGSGWQDIPTGNVHVSPINFKDKDGKLFYISGQRVYEVVFGTNAISSVLSGYPDIPGGANNTQYVAASTPISAAFDAQGALYVLYRTHSRNTETITSNATLNVIIYESDKSIRTERVIIPALKNNSGSNEKYLPSNALVTTTSGVKLFLKEENTIVQYSGANFETKTTIFNGPFGEFFAENLKGTNNTPLTETHFFLSDDGGTGNLTMRILANNGNALGSPVTVQNSGFTGSSFKLFQSIHGSNGDNKLFLTYQVISPRQIINFQGFLTNDNPFSKCCAAPIKGLIISKSGSTYTFKDIPAGITSSKNYFAELDKYDRLWVMGGYYSTVGTGFVTNNTKLLYYSGSSWKRFRNYSAGNSQNYFGAPEATPNFAFWSEPNDEGSGFEKSTAFSVFTNSNKEVFFSNGSKTRQFNYGGGVEILTTAIVNPHSPTWYGPNNVGKFKNEIIAKVTLSDPIVLPSSFTTAPSIKLSTGTSSVTGVFLDPATNADLYTGFTSDRLTEQLFFKATVLAGNDDFGVPNTIGGYDIIHKYGPSVQAGNVFHLRLGQKGQTGVENFTQLEAGFNRTVKFGNFPGSWRKSSLSYYIDIDRPRITSVKVARPVECKYVDAYNNPCTAGTVGCMLTCQEVRGNALIPGDKIAIRIDFDQQVKLAANGTFTATLNIGNFSVDGLTHTTSTTLTGTSANITPSGIGNGWQLIYTIQERDFVLGGGNIALTSFSMSEESVLDFYHEAKIDLYNINSLQSHTSDLIIRPDVPKIIDLTAAQGNDGTYPTSGATIIPQFKFNYALQIRLKNGFTPSSAYYEITYDNGFTQRHYWGGRFIGAFDVRPGTYLASTYETVDRWGINTNYVQQYKATGDTRDLTISTIKFVGLEAIDPGNSGNSLSMTNDGFVTIKGSHVKIESTGTPNQYRRVSAPITSFADNKAIVQQGALPTITSVTGTNGTYTSSGTITLTVTTSESVAISGTNSPTLVLNVKNSSGTQTKTAVYIGSDDPRPYASATSSNATRYLNFLLTVDDGDYTNGKLDAVALELPNGTTITDGTNNLALSIPTSGNLAAKSAIYIDKSGPVITAITLNPTNTTATLQFNEALLSTQTLTANSFTLSITSGTVSLTSNVSTSATISGTTVIVGLPALTGTVLGTEQIQITPPSTLVDSRNFSYTETSLVRGTLSDQTASAAPTIDLEDASDTGTSNTDNITKDKTPTLTVTGGAANYTVQFTLTNTTTSTTLSPSFSVNSSTSSVTFSELNDGVYSVSAVLVDPSGNTSASSSTLTLTIDSTAPSNQDAVIPATFYTIQSGSVSATVVSSGDITNRIWVAPAGTAVFSATATSTLNTDGTTTTVAVPSAEGEYKVYVEDAAGNVSAASNALIVRDLTLPSILSVTSTTANGEYGSPSNVNLTLTFAESVVLSGTLSITLNSGAQVSVSSLTSSNTISTTYPVGDSDQTNDLSISSITVTAGTLSDLAGNTLSQSGTVSITAGANLADNKAIKIDNSAPTLTTVTATPTGTYKAGDVIKVILGFDDVVTLSGSGTISVTLNSGASITANSLTSSNTLSIDYVVQSGNNTNGSKLDLTGVTLTGTLTNAAGLTTSSLVSSTVVSNISSNTAVYIDNSTPVISLTSSGPVNNRSSVNYSTNESVGTVYMVLASKTVTNTSHITSLPDREYNQVTVNAGTGTISTTELVEGTYKLYHIDLAGNVGSSTATITVDNTAPSVSLLSTGSFGMSNSIKYQVNEAAKVYLTKTTNGANSSTTNNNSIVTDINDSGTLSSTFNFVSVSSSGVGVNNSLNLLGLSNGDYKLFSIDLAGNISVLTENTITVDGTAPTPTLGTTGINTTSRVLSSNSTTISFRSNELGNAYLVSSKIIPTTTENILNSSNTLVASTTITSTTATLTISISNLNEGEYYLYVTDLAGNLSTTRTTTNKVIIDKSGPILKEIYLINTRNPSKKYLPGEEIYEGVGEEMQYVLEFSEPVLFNRGTSTTDNQYISDPNTWSLTSNLEWNNRQPYPTNSYFEKTKIQYVESENSYKLNFTGKIISTSVRTDVSYGGQGYKYGFRLLETTDAIRDLAGNNMSLTNANTLSGYTTKFSGGWIYWKHVAIGNRVPVITFETNSIPANNTISSNLTISSSTVPSTIYVTVLSDAALQTIDLNKIVSQNGTITSISEVTNDQIYSGYTNKKMYKIDLVDVRTDKEFQLKVEKGAFFTSLFSNSESIYKFNHSGGDLSGPGFEVSFIDEYGKEYKNGQKTTAKKGKLKIKWNDDLFPFNSASNTSFYNQTDYFPKDTLPSGSYLSLLDNLNSTVIPSDRRILENNIATYTPSQTGVHDSNYPNAVSKVGFAEPTQATATITYNGNYGSGLRIYINGTEIGYFYEKSLSFVMSAIKTHLDNNFGTKITTSISGGTLSITGKNFAVSDLPSTVTDNQGSTTYTKNTNIVAAGTTDSNGPYFLNNDIFAVFEGGKYASNTSSFISNKGYNYNSTLKEATYPLDASKSYDFVKFQGLNIFGATDVMGNSVASQFQSIPFTVSPAVISNSPYNSNALWFNGASEPLWNERFYYFPTNSSNNILLETGMNPIPNLNNAISSDRLQSGTTYHIAGWHKKDLGYKKYFIDGIDKIYPLVNSSFLTGQGATVNLRTTLTASNYDQFLPNFDKATKTLLLDIDYTTSSSTATITYELPYNLYADGHGNFIGSGKTSAGSLSGTNYIFKLIYDETPLAPPVLVSATPTTTNPATVLATSTYLGKIYAIHSSVLSPTSESQVLSLDKKLFSSVTVSSTSSTYTITTTTLSDGLYYLYGTNSDGKISTASSGNFRVDKDRPVGLVISNGKLRSELVVQTSEIGNGYLIINTHTPLPLTLSDIGNIQTPSKYEFSLDQINTNSSINISQFNSGTYYFYVSDGVNISNLYPKNVVIDNSLPVATLITTGTITPSSNISVSSSEIGELYLVNSSVASPTVVDLLKVDGNKINSLSATSTSTVQLSTAGLIDGTYKLYAVDEAGNLSPPSSNSITIDGTTPVLTSLSATPSSGSFKAGDVINFVLTFDSPITYSGTMSMTLSNGVVLSSSITSTTTITVPYTISSGQDATALTVSSIYINPASPVRDLAQNSLSGSISATTNSIGNINIDTQAPTITLSTSGTISPTQTISFTSSEMGTAYFATSNTYTNTAQLIASSGVYSATINAVGANTISATAITPNTNVYLYVTDQSGNTSVLSNTSIFVDSATPTATLSTTGTINDATEVSVQSTELGTAYLVNTSTLSVTSLTDITTAPDSKWNSVPISTINTGTSLSTSGLISGTYQLYAVDNVGNLSVASTASVTIDTEEPYVTSVTAGTSSATLTAGQTASITVNFSEPVTFSNGATLTLQLNVGRSLTFTSTNSGGLSATATYTVQDGDYTTDLDNAAVEYLVGGDLKDAAGNDFISSNLTGTRLAVNSNIVVDASKPVPVLISEGSFNPSQSVSLTVDKTSTTVYLVLDDNTYSSVSSITALSDDSYNTIANVSATVTSTIQLSTLKSGTYVLYAIDASGNFSAKSNNSIIVDADNPVVELQTLGIIKNTEALEFTVSEASTVYIVPSTTLTTTTSTAIAAAVLSTTTTNESGTVSVTITSVPDGTYKLFAVDTRNNSGVSSETFTVDSNAGTITLTSTGYKNLSDLLTFSASEFGTAYLIDATLDIASAVSSPTSYDARFNSIEVSSSSGTLTATVNTEISTKGLQNGTYKMVLIDYAGNISPSSTNSITIDTEAAVVSVTSTNATDIYSGTETITIQSTESGIGYIVNSTAITELTSTALQSLTASPTLAKAVTIATANSDVSISLSGLVSGVYFIYAEDPAKNISNAATRKINIDLTSPLIQAVSTTAADGIYISGNTVPLKLYLSESATLSGTLNLTLNTGETVQITSLTNSDVISTTYTVGGTASSTTDLTIQSISLSSGGTLKDDAQNATTLFSLASFINLAASSDIVIDNTLPTVTLTDNQSDRKVKNGDVVGITATFSESMTSSPTLTIGSLGTYTMTSTNASSWTYSWTVSATTGVYSATVAGVDLAGNAYAGTSSLTYEVDNDAPSITNVTSSWGSALNITESAAGGTISLTTTGVEDGQVITATLTPGSSTYSATVTNNAAVITLSSPALTLSDGTYSMTFIVSDVAGNASGTQSMTFTVDRTVPQVLTSSNSWGSVLNIAESALSGVISITTTGASDGDNATLAIGGGSYTSTITSNAASFTVSATYLTSLVDGSTVSYTVVASDAAQNTSSTYSSTFTVDKVAPTLTLNGYSWGEVLNTNESAQSGTISFTTTAEDGQLVEVGLNGVSYTPSVTNATASLTLSSTVLTGLTSSSYSLTYKVADISGNESGTYSSTLLTDKSAPTVLSVSGTNGNYKLGAPIQLEVKFSEPVVITGVPKLALTTGGTLAANASYVSFNSTTNSGVFSYTVQLGDQTNSLEYASITALTLNGGTIKDVQGNDAVLDLPTLGNSNTLSSTSDIAIDGVAPAISTINASWIDTFDGSNGYPPKALNITEKGLDQTIGVITTGVENGQVATIRLVTTGYSKTYTGTILNNSLTVNVPRADLAPIVHGIDYQVFASAEDIAGNTTPLYNITFDADFTPPGIQLVHGEKTSANYNILDYVEKTYRNGQRLDIYLKMNDVSVTVSGSPYLMFDLGGTTKRADHNRLISNSGVKAFSYTIQPGDVDLDGISIPNGTHLFLNGGSMRDASSNFVTETALIFRDQDTRNLSKLKVNGALPVVTIANVSWGDTLNLTESSASGTISITTTDLEEGQVVQLSITNTATNQSNTYTSTITSGGAQIELDATTLTSYVDANTYSITAVASDLGGNASSVASVTFTVDRTVPQVLTSSNSWGSVLNIAESALSGVISITTTGASDGDNATLAIGGGSYTSTITSNAASFTVSATYLTSLVDGSTVSYTVVASDAAQNTSSTYSSTFTVDKVAPTLTLNGYSWGEVLNTNESAQSGTISFTTTAEDGQLVEVGLNGVSYTPSVTNATASLTLSSTVLTGLTSSSYSLTYKVADISGNESGTYSSTLLTDKSAPTVLSVSGTNGNYKLGAPIQLEVKFSEPVVITGVPKLALTTGGTLAANASYVSFNSTTNSGVFSYTVQLGDQTNSLEYASITALTLNGGTIKDVQGNDAVLDLPTLGNSNTLSSTSDIAIDGVAPAISTINASWIAATDGSSGRPPKALNITEKGLDQTIGVITTGVENGQVATIRLVTTGYSKTYTGTILNNSLTVNVPRADLAPIVHGIDYQVFASAEDIAGNTTPLYNITFDADFTPPGIQLVHGEKTSANYNILDYVEKTYRNGQRLDIYLKMNDVSVTVSGSPYLMFDLGGTTKRADHNRLISNSGVKAFSYTIQPGDVDLDGISIPNGTHLFLNGGSMRDASSNFVTETALIFRDQDTRNLSKLKVNGALPVVTIANVSWGDTLNLTESSASGTISITTTDLEEGQVVQLSITNTATNQSNTYTSTITSGGAQIELDATTLTSYVDANTYSITAVASDLGGNASSVASVTFTVDRTVPQVLTSSNSWGSVLNIAESALSGVISITTNGASDGDNATLAIGGGSYTSTITSNTASFTVSATYLTSLVDGSTVSYTVVANDAAQNTSSTYSSTFTVDTKAPSITITSTLSRLAPGQQTTLTFTSSEPITNFDLNDITVSTGSVSDFTIVNSQDFTVKYTYPSITANDVTFSLLPGKVDDLVGNSNTLTSTLTLVLNSGPVGSPVPIIITQDDPDMVINLTNGISDPDGDPLNVENLQIVYTMSSGGSQYTTVNNQVLSDKFSKILSSQSLNGNELAINTSNSNFLSGTQTGKIEISYDISDGTYSLKVNNEIVITGKNDAPSGFDLTETKTFQVDSNGQKLKDIQGNDLTAEIKEDLPIYSQLVGIDSDLGDRITYILGSTDSLGRGKLEFNTTNGSYKYTPALHFYGDVFFEYFVEDLFGIRKGPYKVVIKIAESPDDDGIPTSLETIALNNDLDNDGVPDRKQANISNFPITSAAEFQAGKNWSNGIGSKPAISTMGSILIGDLSSDSLGITNPKYRLDPNAKLSNIGIVPKDTTNINLAFQSDLYKFSIIPAQGKQLLDLDNDASNGLQTRVVINLPVGINASTYLKSLANGQVIVFKDDQNLDTWDDGATLIDTDKDGLIDRIVVTITDNGRGDSDPTIGRISDPGGLGFVKPKLDDFTSKTLNEGQNTGTLLVDLNEKYSNKDFDLENDTLNYSFSSTTASTVLSALSINPKTGEIKVNERGAFDFEAFVNNNGVSIIEADVIISDKNLFSDTASIKIPLKNLDEIPTIVSNKEIDFMEKQKPEVIVVDMETLPDYQDLTSFIILAGKDANDFNLEPSTGVLRFNQSPEFSKKKTYKIDVNTIDVKGNSDIAEITINILNKNENPSDILLSKSSVEENLPLFTNVGIFNSKDEDEGDTFIYELVSGIGDSNNSSFKLVGDTLKTASTFDFENKRSYLIRVRVTDVGGLSYEKQFNIAIIDVNEDTDGDGIWDDLEKGPNLNSPIDTDKDGLPDYLDLDSDDDGIFDKDEAGPNPFKPLDSDGDGISDYREIDSDNDGYLDGYERNIDTDRDGIPDFQDLDSDGDGIEDKVEDNLDFGNIKDCDRDGIENRLDPDVCELILPQIITPNGDGLNDVLIIPGILRLQPNRLTIINRWGSVVFDQENYQNNWGGISFSGELPDGVYYYVVDFKGAKPTISNYVYLDRTGK